MRNRADAEIQIDNLIAEIEELYNPNDIIALYRNFREVLKVRMLEQRAKQEKQR